MNKTVGNWAIATLLGVVIYIPFTLLAAESYPTWPGIPDITVEPRKVKSVFVPMRDGVRLSTDIYFPEEVEGKLPVIMMRSPYNKSGAYPYGGITPLFVQEGYIVVVQDSRGRFESEGAYQAKNWEKRDGYDTVEWLIQQPWSDGQVATYGCSYLGEVQISLAAAKHPNHVAMIPQASTAAYNNIGRPFGSINGGVMELMETAGWFIDNGSTVFHGPPAGIDRQEWFQSEQSKYFRTGPQFPDGPRDQLSTTEIMNQYSTLPSIDIARNAGMPYTDYEEYLLNAPESDYFRGLDDLVRPDDTFDVPALYMDSWYDYGPRNTLKMFNQMRDNSTSKKSRDNQFVIIAPGTHCRWVFDTENTIIGERDLGNAQRDYVDIYLKWYEYWLKGIDNGITDMPRVQYYLMGKNEWRSAESWPVEGTVYRNYYLNSGGRANSRLGDGTLSASAPATVSSDTFSYDPKTPVPMKGGHACCSRLETAAGGYDQREIEMRNDVLVYTSPVLDKGIDVTGFLEVVLYVSSDAKDTDFTAKLVDVYPDGRAFNIQEGILRMRYREDLRNKVLMEEGEVYKIHLDLDATSNHFGEGHRIRLEVSSSHFPRWERNMNTGGNNYDESEGVVARNTVHHSPEYPSHIILPIVE